MSTKLTKDDIISTKDELIDYLGVKDNQADRSIMDMMFEFYTDFIDMDDPSEMMQAINNNKSIIQSILKKYKSKIDTSSVDTDKDYFTQLDEMWFKGSRKLNESINIPDIVKDIKRISASYKPSVFNDIDVNEGVDDNGKDIVMVSVTLNDNIYNLITPNSYQVITNLAKWLKEIRQYLNKEKLDIQCLVENHSYRATVVNFEIYPMNNLSESEILYQQLFESKGTPIAERYDDPVARYGKDPLNKIPNSIAIRSAIKDLEKLISSSFKELKKIAANTPSLPNPLQYDVDNITLLAVDNDFSSFGMVMPDNFTTEGMTKAQLKFVEKNCNNSMFEQMGEYYAVKEGVINNHNYQVQVTEFDDYTVTPKFVQWVKMYDKLFNTTCLASITKWQKVVYNLYNGINGILGSLTTVYGYEAAETAYKYIVKKYPTYDWFKDTDWDM